MQFEFPFRSGSSPTAELREQWLEVGGRRVRLRMIPNRRARRYILRLQNDGTARVTIPRRGSAREASRFVARNVAWLEKQLLRQTCEMNRSNAWKVATEILFRGETVPLEHGGNGESGIIRFGAEAVRVADPTADLRPEVEQYLWELSAKELTARTVELSRVHGVAIRRVSVRNERSRWGSCSRRGTISLNWRLIQTPSFVCDYIILHELAHLKEMNHSHRFWREVERLCPNYAEAECWLRRHSSLLR